MALANLLLRRITKPSSLGAWLVIALWCNGSTSDFESEVIGSIPIGATHIKYGDGGTVYASVLEAEF